MLIGPVYIRSTFMYKHRLRLYFSLKLVIMMSTSMSKGRDNIVEMFSFLSAFYLYRYRRCRFFVSMVARFAYRYRNFRPYIEMTAEQNDICSLDDRRFISVAVCEHIQYNQIGRETFRFEGAMQYHILSYFNDKLCELNETLHLQNRFLSNSFSQISEFQVLNKVFQCGIGNLHIRGEQTLQMLSDGCTVGTKKKPIV